MSSNIALNKPAQSQSSFAPFTPNRAVNGSSSKTSRWVDANMPTWMMVDLLAPNWINQVVIKMMGDTAAGWTSNYNLQDFMIQGSLDLINWATLRSYIGNINSSVTFLTAPVEVRYLRVAITKGLSVNNKVASITDLEVYNQDNPPYLASLTVSPGTLSPAFTPQVFDYSVDVANSVQNITITPVAQQNTATVTVGKDSETYSLPATVPLGIGTNVIGVTVTSADRTMTDKYNLIVTRASAAPVYLSNLQLQNPGDLSIIPLSPTFAPQIYTYSAEAIVASVLVTPTGAGEIRVNNVAVASGNPLLVNLQSGENLISITIKSSGGQVTSYTVVVLF